MKKLLQAVLALLVIAAVPAQAEVYQYNVKGYTAFAWSKTAAVRLHIDGSGVNRKVMLYANSGVSGVDYKYWGGEIPADAVTVNGINSISVNINTCTVLSNIGCGLVDVTMTTLAGYENFRTRTGAWNYTTPYATFNYVGHLHDRYADVAGTVNGYPLNITGPSWNSIVSQTSELSVSVFIGN